MNKKDYMHLVEPLYMLIGYCESATDLTKDSNLEAWSARAVELANNLRAAWVETALNKLGDE